MRNIGIRCRVGVLILSLVIAGMMMEEGQADDVTFSFNADGGLVLDNSLVTITAANRPSADKGIVKWFFKPTGFEMKK